MGIELSEGSVGILITFVIYLLGVAALGIFAHRYVTKGSFVKGYFLGNRGLGPWVLALTIAATAISGGTFMGFPSFIYTRGWVMAIWICSYMVVPLTGMIWLGKRINQVARIGGSVTLPDVFRDRFQSPALGVIASVFILIFIVFNLIGQFKGGGLIMQSAMRVRPSPTEIETQDLEIKGKDLILHFRTPDGPDEKKVPLPSEKAELLRAKTKIDHENRIVHVHFQDGAKEVQKKVSFPQPKMKVLWFEKKVEKGYLIGLIIFAMTVIAYTTYGGFWAVTWTDVLEGLVMLVGVIVMAILAVNAVQADGKSTGLAAATESLRQQEPALVQGPGPGAVFPLGMAFSYFIMWSVSGAGQPSGMVRLMSFKDSASLRRAMLLIAVYYLLTYVCLLVIFICARAIFPTEYLKDVGSEGEPDRIMPEMVRHLTNEAGVPWLAGLLLAAPYAAIMSTVAAFLLMISSSLVRDLYQRSINPNASQKTLKRVSYITTAVVGLVVMIGAINPPDFLQYVIVFTGSGQSCAFFFPMLFTLYWRRTTKQGVLAGMLGGALTILLLYVLGWLDGGSRAALESATTAGEENPAVAVWLQENLRWIPGWGDQRVADLEGLNLAGFDPIVWGFLVSLILTVGVSLRTPPQEELIRKYFPETPKAPAG